MSRTERDIVIGKIVAPLGIRGEVKVVVLTDFPERFDAGSDLTLRLTDGNRRPVKVKSQRLYKDGLALTLEGLETRNDAEDIRGAEFVVDVDELRQLPEDTFYIFDLIGLKVITTDGRECGEVTEIMHGGANDVYLTSTGLCIPALKEVVEKIDIGQGTLTIRPVPGLLD
ncbi:MAG: ribosome maturation factor RimM [Armatimonadota bacterium]|jgi:16S rRNA processing protein RimM